MFIRVFSITYLSYVLPYFVKMSDQARPFSCNTTYLVYISGNNSAPATSMTFSHSVVRLRLDLYIYTLPPCAVAAF